MSAILAGESCRTAATRFGVSASSAIKWSRRYRLTGSVAPGQMGGHRRPVLMDHRAFILERISQTPHLTLHGLKGDQVKRLKELEAENARLRRAVSDLTLDKMVLAEAARGNF